MIIFGNHSAQASTALSSAGHPRVAIHGVLLVNPGSVGLPFREFVAGGPPTILPHAEYAVIEAEAGTVGVSLRRVALARSALRAAAAAWDSPMRLMLMKQYEE